MSRLKKSLTLLLPYNPTPTLNNSFTFISFSTPAPIVKFFVFKFFPPYKFTLILSNTLSLDFVVSIDTAVPVSTPSVPKRITALVFFFNILPTTFKTLSGSFFLTAFSTALLTVFIIFTFFLTLTWTLHPVIGTYQRI